MSTQEQQLARLRGFNASVRAADRGLAEELAGRFESQELGRPMTVALAEETIVMRRQRPVLAIQDGETTLQFREAEDSEIWKERLVRARPYLAPAIAAVGRVDLQHNPDFEWVGTGWLVDRDILVTNRHVANTFARRMGGEIRFRPGSGGQAMAAEIDFLHELDRTATRAFRLVRVLHIEDEDGPDLSFVRVEQTKGPLATPIRLSSRAAAPSSIVATIGYPAYDSRIPEPALMERIYGSVYNLKRLAPGAITDVDAECILHNCTTLGGNSGSVVLDLETGEALGLHFSGRFLLANYAVRADIVKQRLDALRSGAIGPRRERAQVPAGDGAARATRVEQAVAPAAGGAASVSIPLVVTVSLGDGVRAPEPAAVPSGDDEVAAEAPIADYRDREGYRADFLGPSFPVELPEIRRDVEDVLVFGDDQTVLAYEHFSVVMSKDRRVCRYSACNVDGAQSRNTKRAAWRCDPRIPRTAQILRECYGGPPKFSRGHMTRRQDPAWGTPVAARRGNEDSMHVTNTVPQMQTFNSPIWLGLEDYALQHAREDDMKISVFTGPYFDARDPVRYGVQIPLVFWKIIAFLHDETGALCATGYEMSQEALLEPEFVFGNYRSMQLNATTQVPIASIEDRAGLGFGELARRDPMAGERIGGGRVPLGALEQIRFV